MIEQLAGVRRVLMVNKFQYAKGGAELYMYGLARLLEQQGVEIGYFGMRHPRNVESSTAGHYVSQVDFESPPPGAERLRVAARAVYSIEARRRISQLLSAEPAFDVAHLHNIYHQLSPSILAPLHRAGLPVVMTVHDYKLVCPVYTLTSHGQMCERCVGGHFQNAVRLRCNRGSLAGSVLVAGESWLHRTLKLWEHGIDVFVTPSSYLRDKLIAGGYPAERVVAVPNFVDPERFRASPEPGGHFLYLGRLSHEKGVETLIEAVAGTPMALRVAGEGPERERLEQMAASSGVDIEFVGHQTGDRLEQLVAGARAVVVPSRWPENCPLVVLEAMAVAKPLVASRVGGIPELARDGEQALLVEQGDAAALRAAMLRLHESDDLTRRLGLAGRARVESLYGPERHLQAVAAAYRQASRLRLAAAA
jgi:glycosyltransferase involved in cell wall biosynthesis